MVELELCSSYMIPRQDVTTDVSGSSVHIPSKHDELQLIVIDYIQQFYIADIIT